MGFLERSSAAFDAGCVDEAIRMATTIRVLIHNTATSTSLLKHLNATTISLMSSCDGASPSALLYMGLGVQQVKNEAGTIKATYAPLLDGPVKIYVPVSKWWDMIVYVLGSGARLSRKKIVLTAANKDGGAHVDSALTPEYEALARDGSVGYFVSSMRGKTNEQAFTEAHLVAVRQMVHELLNSPELLRYL
jgi:hypothetical protein